MTTKTFDAVVIGAGPGGYACAIRLAQLGLKTACVEKGALGGVCLNVGCIPSKALIQAAKTFEKIKAAGTMGVVVESAHVDFPKMQAWKDGVVKKLTGGIGQLFKGNGVEHVAGAATLTAPGRLEVKTASGETIAVEAEHVVLATGSRPIEIPGFAFGGRVLSSTEALALQEVPERLVVIGGGVIGLELGTVYAKLGSRVTVVEATDGLLPGVDPELTAVVAKKLKAKGVTVLTGAKAQGYTEEGGVARVKVRTPSGEQVLDADKILLAVSRRPNSENLGLEALGVKVERGFVVVDDQLKTNVPGLYAIGDVAGQPMLAHKASRDAEVVAEVIAGHAHARIDTKTIPGVIFTDPEIATTGLSPAEADAKGLKYKVGKFPFVASGRALSMGETDGFVKVLVEESTHELLGFGIVGPQASDLVAEATLAIEMGAFADDVALTVHAHPTLPEAVMEAVKHAVGEAVHIPNTPALAKR